MESKKGVVTAVTGNGTWESAQYGMFYRFEVAFDNGDVGEYSSKDQQQNKFVLGKETEYELHTTERGGNTYHKIKPARPQGGFSGGGYSGGGKSDPEREVRIVRQSCLKASVELIAAGKLDIAQIYPTTEQLVEYCMHGTMPSTEKGPSPF